MHARKVSVRFGERMAVVELRADGTAVVEGDAADAPPLALHYMGHGRLRLSDDRRVDLAHVVDDGEVRWVFVDGEVLRVEIVEPTQPPLRKRAGGHESLAAPMPATVVRLMARVGDVVERGASLVILEAMKMELPLRAPHRAVVRAIHCAEGDLVQPGASLVELDVVEP